MKLFNGNFKRLSGKDKITVDLIAKYLSGNCTDIEEDKIKLWLSSNIENLEYFNSFKAVWEAGGQNSTEWNENEAWTKMEERRRIYGGEYSSALGIKYFLKRDEMKAHAAKSSYHYAVRIAAVILIILTAILVYSSLNTTPQVTLNESYAKRGEIKKVTLSDGSIVTLNSTSRLRYSSVFNGTREVFLEGEAFFDVAHDSKRPFIVHLNNAEVKVLGTRFNVKGWDGESKYQVVVETGKVSFSTNDNNGRSEVVLTKNQMSVMETGAAPSSPISVDARIQTAWISGQLLFNKTTLREVISLLEKKYDVSITVADKSNMSLLLTASFKGESIETIIETIGRALDLNYTIKDNKVNYY